MFDKTNYLKKQKIFVIDGSTVTPLESAKSREHSKLASTNGYNASRKVFMKGGGGAPILQSS